MGLSYGFEFIVPRAGVRQLLSVLAKYLCDEDRRRVSKVLAHGPPSGHTGSNEHDCISPAPSARGVSEDRAWIRSWSPENSYCFSFLFRLDDEALTGYDPDWRPSENGSARVGCVYTSLAVGDRYVVLQATAATSDMSRLFQTSVTVQETFRAIAERAEVSSLFLDIEDNEWTLIWPHRRPCSKPDGETFDYWWYDFDPEAIDLYCAEALRLADIG